MITYFWGLNGGFIAGDKFNIIMAEMINPKIKADLYLDRGENESELKQVRTNMISLSWMALKSSVRDFLEV